MYKMISDKNEWTDNMKKGKMKGSRKDERMKGWKNERINGWKNEMMER